MIIIRIWTLKEHNVCVKPKRKGIHDQIGMNQYEQL